jgi:eukaryotic-like serine/threonine-protein kinase
MPLVAGSRLGNYEILAPLGKGGMGEVYRAKDAHLRREVAIKLLAPDRALDPEAMRRFESEARAAGALNHPNIVSVHHIGRQDGASYIVMELVDGEPLGSLIRRGPLTLKKFLDIAVQAVDGLAAAHQAGITHRDLKPENIMIARDGRVKILDFGLALHVRSATLGSGETTLTAARTQPGTLLGTIHYMSPEQARSETVDYRSDQFSFGVVLYEMATGIRVFERKSTAETLQAILSEEAPSIPERSPIPVPIRWIISRCLQKEPGERYGSTADLYRDLRAHRDYLFATGATAAQRHLTRRRVGLAGAALVCLAGVALAWWLAWPPVSDLAAYRYTPFALDAGMDSWPAWSPDGKTIAYLHEIDGVAQVVTRGLQSGVPAQITKPPQTCTQLFWSSDGSRIYYIAGLQLWAVGAAGGEPQLVLKDVMHAAISPDQRTIAFGKPGAEGKLWLHSLADGKTAPYPAPLEGQSMTRQVRFSPDGATIGALWPSQREHTLDNTFWLLPFPPGPAVRSLALDASSFAWMPDSRHLVVAKSSSNGTGRHLFWIDTKTHSMEPLTTGLGSEERPDVSPDGSRIALTSGGIDSDLVEVSLDGSPVKTLLATSRNETNPSWSPDGTQFAYVQNSAGPGTEIWLRTVDGDWSRPLLSSTKSVVTYTNPRFSPDGRRLVYESWSPEGYILWVTTLGGGAPVRLTMERNHQHHPAWSPDGNWIAYRANVGDQRLLEKAPSGGGRPVTLAKTVSTSSILWSPTGEWLCYTDGQAFHLVSPDGSRQLKLLDSAATSFAFTPDGKRILFILRAGLKWSLWSADLSGGHSRMERSIDISSAAVLRGFALHPDGKRFATSAEVSREDIWILEGFKPRGGLLAWLPWFGASRLTE